MSILEAFFIGPWRGPWFLGNTLDSIALLLTAAAGTLVAFRGGCFNLGAEGQVYLGGVAASCVLLGGNDWNHALILIGAAAAALMAGGCMGGIAGILKRYCGAHEVISSFLLSSALTPVADYTINNYLRDKSGNLIASPLFSATLPHLLPPSHLSVSFIGALTLVLMTALFINTSSGGYRFRLAGADRAFAHYGGIEAQHYWVPSLALSGALCALAGFFAVAGTYGRCHLGFSGSLGWHALAVTLIAGNRPLALFPAALLYGAVKAGSEAALLITGLQLETASFIQAAVLLVATAQLFPRHKRQLPFKKGAEQGGRHD
ncbi:MAG: ABC transporter permease [Spirochaetaceae bacterium]|jgi:simple sugar transport system permease protein|nr:ABC transporter permease [Spirochaetaceae bacterium]